MIKTEHKYIEILRILIDYQDPMGAKRLSELLAERGYVMTDRAVQYYLRYLDTRGFTEKIGNQGRILTKLGISETERALVDDRIGFVISKLERLAFLSSFDPESATGDVAYNLTIVPESVADPVLAIFDRVRDAGCSFFHGYSVLDNNPRVPDEHIGVVTICSITLDGVFQHHGIPVKVAYGGTIRMHKGSPVSFVDLIGYKGSTVDPLQLFINSGLTSINHYISSGSGDLLANVRQIPLGAEKEAKELSRLMQDCGFRFPLMMGRREVFNLITDPHRISLVSFSGMNSIGAAAEDGFRLTTEIGAGTIPFSRVSDY